MPDMFEKYSVWLADFSYHAGTIAAEVMSSKLDGVLIRIGDGNLTNLDTRWVINWSAFRGKSPRGSWWFFRGNHDPIVQANKCIGALRADIGDLPFYVDVEKPDIGYVPVSQAVYRSNLQRFISTMDDFLSTAGKYPKQRLCGIYSSVGAYSTLMGGRLGIDHSQRSLWVANWDVFIPVMPSEWMGRWDFWQWTKAGVAKDWGVTSYTRTLDLNVYNGSLDKYRAEFHISLPPRPPVPDRGTPKQVKIKGWGTKIRNQPNDITGAVIGTATLNAVWPVEATVRDSAGRGDWVKITDGVYIAGWLVEYIY